MSTNIHDGTVHILQAFPHEGVCAQYADIEAVREHGKECSQALGPNQVGINFPDRTAPRGYDGKDRGPGGNDADPVQPNERRTREVRPDDEVVPPDQRDPAADRGDRDRGGSGQAPKPGGGSAPAPPVQLPKLDEILPGNQDDPPKAPELPQVDPPPGVPDVGKKLPLSNDERRQGGEELMDYLFGS
jgi:hypothetical protein